MAVFTLLAGLSWTAGAQQLSDYSFDFDQTDFQTIVGQEGVQTPGLSNHDSGYDDVTLPFAFPFGESQIAAGSTIRINANGYLQINPTSNGGESPYDNVWSSSSYTYKLIAPGALTDAQCNAPVGQGIYYLDTVDDEGNALLIFEFRQMTGYFTRTTATSLNYQIQIFENGTISVVYDTVVIDNATFKRNIVLTNGHDDRLCLTGSWAEPAVGTPSSIPSLTDIPEPGSRYTFSRPDGFCPRPSDLTLTEATSESLTFSWSGQADTYHVLLDGEEVLVVGETEATIADLDPNTEHTLAVQAECDADLLSTASSPLTARTLCSPLTEADLPFLEDFESYTTTNAGWNPCWTRLYKGYDGQLATFDQYNTQVIYTTSASVSGNQALRMQVTPQVNSGVDRQFAIVALPLFDADIAGYQLSFNYSSSQAANNLLEVGMMAVASDTATFVPFDTLAFPTTANTWTEASTLLPDEATGHIALRWSTTAPSGYSTYYLYIDDIAVMVPSACARPDSLVVTGIAENSATLTVYAPQGEDLTGAHFSVSFGLEGGDEMQEGDFYGATYELQGLASGKAQSVTVTRLCDDGSSTLPVSTSFRTLCGTLTADDLPFTENFDSYEAYNTTTLDPCWNTLNFNISTYNTYPLPRPTAYENHLTLNGRALYFSTRPEGKGQFLCLPAFDDLSQLAVTFWTKIGNDYSRFDVGVMSDPTDSASFTALATVEPASTSWEEHTVRFESYTGEGHYIAFHAYSDGLTNYESYLDDITVDIALSCARPLSASVTAATTTSLTLAVTDTAQGGHYQVTYCADGSEDTVAVDDLDFEASYTDPSRFSATLTDLLPGTVYHFAVATICSADGSLTAPVACMGQTRCEALAAADLPLEEGFTNWPLGMGEAFGPCWLRYYDGDSLGNRVPNKVYVQNDAGSRALHLYAEHSFSDGAQRSTVVLPLVDTVPQMLQLDIRMRFQGIFADSNDFLEVGIMPDADDPASFVPVHTIFNPGASNGSAQYANYTVRFGRYSGADGNVALRYSYTPAGIDYSYAWVDSLSLVLLDEPDVPCDVTGLVATEVTDSSALLGWQYDCEADSFLVEIKEGYHTEVLTAQQPALQVATGSYSFALTGLDADTTYRIRVRGPHATDEWSAPVVISTVMALPVDTTHVTPVDTTSTDTTQVSIAVVGRSAFALYPNPASGQVTVDAPAAGWVAVLDQSGRVVLRREVSGGRTPLSVADLPAGAYFVRLTTGGETQVRKLIVR